MLTSFYLLHKTTEDIAIKGDVDKEAKEFIGSSGCRLEPEGKALSVVNPPCERQPGSVGLRKESGQRRSAVTPDPHFDFLVGGELLKWANELGRAAVPFRPSIYRSPTFTGSGEVEDLKLLNGEPGLNLTAERDLCCFQPEGQEVIFPATSSAG